MSDRTGSLACVGVGMTLGAHIGPRARAHIEQADVVFVAVSDPLVELWVQGMNADVRSLQPFYGEGKVRTDTYREMVEAMLAEVKAGKRVCGAFYGHPGVFAVVPHRAVALAREAGYEAVMEAAVSAEDCLYADLGIDPGTVGCQHFEASQFMFYRRVIDTSAFLVLWQVGVAGDPSLMRFSQDAALLDVLVELLRSQYPARHEVIVYEAATLPQAGHRALRLPLEALPGAALTLASTLVVPPCSPMVPNREVQARIRGMASAGGRGAEYPYP
jgi:precorrin-6B methylase 1